MALLARRLQATVLTSDPNDLTALDPTLTLYVLLARDLDAVLVTADERLHTAATGMPVHLLSH